jgi:hypothetical protein
MSENMSENMIYIQDYTAKSFVVRGDTRSYREAIKSMGGKWNSSLTDRETGNKFGAWIFWGEKRKSIEEWIATAVPDSKDLDTENKYEVATDITSRGSSNDNSVKKPSLEEKIDRLLGMMTSICRLHDIKLEAEDLKI